MKKLLTLMVALAISSPVLAETDPERLKECLMDADIAEVISMKRQQGIPRQVITDSIESTMPENLQPYFNAIVNSAYSRPIQVTEQARNNVNTEIRNLVMNICLES